MFAACSETEVLENSVQQKATDDGAVKFDVYAQRGITRGGGQTGDLTNANIGENGFGVFAFYTNNKQYDQTAQPNFMYNQQVTCDGTATEGTLWKYEPVKYWPNEFGSAAISDDVDYVSFFAYAPYTKFVPETGEIDIKGMADDVIEKAQKFNIVSVNKNTATGDPIIKYVVDTDPGTSVDLLWGVAAENAAEVYTPISGEGSESGQNKFQIADPGLPFLDMVKPNNPSTDRLRFNLKHALAKVKFTIDYIADAKTPGGEWAGEDGTEPDEFPVEINAEQTRIFVRSFKIDGWATEGALNLNNDEPGVPLWKAFDGVTDLTFGEVTFFDGRKDGKEATTNGEQKSEKPLGLNKNIIEVYGGDKIFGADQNDGVTKVPQLLFDYAEGNDTVNGGYFYVIPRAQGEGVNVTIEYNVETIDSLLAGKLADGVTHGSSIENVISKENIFGENVDFEPGYQYWIKIHIGMTSVKIEATVEPWVDNGETEVDLPDNQDPDPAQEAATENKPSIEGGSEFTLNATYKGVALTEQVTLKVDAEPVFVGSYVKVTASADVVIPAPTAEAPEATENLGKTFYVNAYKLKNGEEVELLTLDEGEEAGDEPGTPSRKFEEEPTPTPSDNNTVTAEGKVFKRTGVFVKKPEATETQTEN